MTSSISDIPVVSNAWAERLQHRQQSQVPELWDMLDVVNDPEVPALSLWDLGVLCDLHKDEYGKVTVWITPTYSGCPAIGTMQDDIESELARAGFNDYEVKTKLAPAWTTDWLSPEGRRKLREYGIAPPTQSACGNASGLTPEFGVECPHCSSSDTKRLSEFGSTACKALFQCNDCHEAFDYFKQI